VAAANRIKHTVLPVSSSPELSGSSLPAIFEQSLCNALFEINDKQVLCPDDLRTFFKVQQERATFGNATVSAEELEESLDAPRKVAINAMRSNTGLAVTVIVQDRGGATLGRFRTDLQEDGSDVAERAAQIAAEIASLAP
jgi:hypothetical protein